jgi:UDP-glucose 4-epimerase
VVELLRNNYEVVIVDDLSNSSVKAIERVEKITGKSIDFRKVDICDEDALKAVFEEFDFDSCIHFAGYKAVGESVSEPWKYYYNNIYGTLILTKLMKEYGVKDLVFSSSATVYGLNNPSPQVEEMPTSATNPYGQTKLMIEQILSDMHVADNEMNITLLRYYNPIGAHESGTIGEDPKGIPNNLMPFVTQVAVGKREFLSVFGDDYDTVDGTGVRDYIHVVDLAIGHVKAIQGMKENGGLNIYNLGTGKGVSVLELVHAFMKVNEIEIPYKIAARRPGDVATCYAGVEKAKNEIGFVAERTLEDMCGSSWKWQKNNPNGYN